MDKYQTAMIIGLLIASVVILIGTAVYFCVSAILEKKNDKYRSSFGISKMLLFSACLLCSVWCLRYAVGYYSIITAPADNGSLTCIEEIFNSVLHALQTFSTDEDYSAYITKGKEMLRSIFGAETVWQTVYGLYASVMNVVAPIAGGAIIFEILISIFPKIKMSVSYLSVWRDKYFFSELNDESLALATSLSEAKAPFLKKPVIIFTDAYADKENEKKTERLLAAKNIGAICVSDDLAHVKKNLWGKRRFFLMDASEAANLQTLSALADKGNDNYLKNAEIFLFTNDDAYVQLEARIYEKLSSSKGFNEDNMPVFLPIKSYRNMISNLLVDLPLYEPLISKPWKSDETKDLTVTILGTGFIGTEMFLSTYWMGQMLNCNLKINVLSQEEENRFWNKIDYINPEIRLTTQKGDPILRIKANAEPADPYCEVKYYPCDVKSSEFIDHLTDKKNNILDTDYFLVSLGSDEINISAANTVRKYVGQHHIETRSPNKAIITYVVYDSQLTDTLNGKRYFNHFGEGFDVYMQAVGCLRDVYSVKNVFMTDHDAMAEKSYDAYAALQDFKKRADIHKKRMADEYKYWADMAKVMHTKYKMYSLGLCKASVFDYNPCVKDDKEALKAYNERLKIHNAQFEKRFSEALEAEMAEFVKIAKGTVVPVSPYQSKDSMRLLHEMAWLEHRRWNAFTRVKGFRHTSEYDAYAVSGKHGSYKQMDIKLHPCLVECDKNGIRGNVSETGVVDEGSLLKATVDSDFDLLDKLSYDASKKGYNGYDFKLYDYLTYHIKEKK